MVLEQLLVLFSLVIVGFIARKFEVLPEHAAKVFSRFVLKIAMPAFILKSMQYKFSPEILEQSKIVLLIACVSYFLVILLAKVYTKIFGNSGDRANVLEYAIVFSNTGFMGYPVVEQLYGTEGVFYAAIYNLAFNVFSFTYGISLLSKHQAKARSLKEKLMLIVQPATIAIVIGYTVFLLGYTYPPAVSKVLDLIGMTATPLSMVFIGLTLTEVDFSQVFKDIQIFSVVFLRLAAIPLLSFFALSFFGFTGLALYVSVVMIAMPVATNGAIFAAEYNSDYSLASLIVFVSTLLSVATLPVLMYYLS